MACGGGCRIGKIPDKVRDWYTDEGEGALRLGVVFLFVGGGYVNFIGFVHAPLEIADGLAEPAADLRQLVGAEEEQDNDKDEQNFLKTNAVHGAPPLWVLLLAIHRGHGQVKAGRHNHTGCIGFLREAVENKHMRRIVVIGNSLATAKVAARIKRLEPSHEVNLVVAATPQTGASGPFADAHAARRASLEMVRNRDVGVVEADDLAVDFEARTVFVTSSRGSLPVRYHTLILEVSADPKLPRALRKAEGVLPWPGDGYGVQNALAARPGCRPVVVGQGQYTLEALRLLQEADLTPTWVRTRDDEDLLDADV